MRKPWFWISLAAVSLSGCWTIKDYGLGECREYKPWCQGTTHQMVCVKDQKGCEVCSCTEMNGEFPLRPYRED